MTDVSKLLDDLIPVLIFQESGGDDGAVGLSGEIGPLQITEAALRDFNHFHEIRDFDYIPYRHKDMHRRDVSINVCRWYLTYYGERAFTLRGTPISHETLARIWNGGPLGYGKESTKQYWLEVKARLQK